MKKIIAFSQEITAPKHPAYQWFREKGGTDFNRGKPIIFRFGDFRNSMYQLTKCVLDIDHDIPLVIYRKEEDIEKKKYVDYDFLCGRKSITFLFDDGTTKQFITEKKRLWNDFDKVKKEPIGVLKELIEFLESYIENNGCMGEPKFQVTTEIEFMDI